MNEFEKRDPGTYTGHDPELAPEKVPGGVQPDDQRIADHPTQAGLGSEPAPSGDDQIKEAGQDR